MTRPYELKGARGEQEKTISSLTDVPQTPAPRDEYFVTSTKRVAEPEPASTDRQSSRVKLTLMILVAACVGVAAFLVVTSSTPEPGSRKDLAGRLDEIVPDSMYQIDEFYQARSECEVFISCPQVTGWYSIQGSVPAARSDLIARLDQEGLEFEPSSVEPNLLVVNDGDYLYFLVFHEPPLDGPLDRTLPSYVEADLSVAISSDL
jgi:hypothetical protein